MNPAYPGKAAAARVNSSSVFMGPGLRRDDSVSFPSPSNLLLDLGVGEHGEEAGAADDVAEQDGDEEGAEHPADPRLARPQQEEGLGGAGDDVGEAADRDQIGEDEHDPEARIV